MTLNEQKLEKWHNSISGFEKLKFPQTKELLKELELEPDFERKKEIRERIILGTLHVIYAFIKSNEIFFLSNANYDMDDVINVHIELWIKAIDSGELNGVSAYSQFFHRSLIKVTNALVGEHEHLYIKDFLLVLDYFLKERPSYDEFSEFFQKNNLKATINAWRACEIFEMYSLLGDITYYVFDNVSECAISDTKKRLLKDLLISFRDYKQLAPNVLTSEFETEVTDKIYCRQILARMKNGRQAPINNFDRFSVIFESRFEEEMSFDAIANKLGICRDNVRQIYDMALERARTIVKVLK